MILPDGLELRDTANDKIKAVVYADNGRNLCFVTNRLAENPDATIHYDSSFDEKVGVEADGSIAFDQKEDDPLTDVDLYLDATARRLFCPKTSIGRPMIIAADTVRVERISNDAKVLNSITEGNAPITSSLNKKRVELDFLKLSGTLKTEIDFKKINKLGSLEISNITGEGSIELEGESSSRNSVKINNVQSIVKLRLELPESKEDRTYQIERCLFGIYNRKAKATDKISFVVGGDIFLRDVHFVKPNDSYEDTRVVVNKNLKIIAKIPEEVDTSDGSFQPLLILCQTKEFHPAFKVVSVDATLARIKNYDNHRIENFKCEADELVINQEYENDTAVFRAINAIISKNDENEAARVEFKGRFVMNDSTLNLGNTKNVVSEEEMVLLSKSRLNLNNSEVNEIKHISLSGVILNRICTTSGSNVFNGSITATSNASTTNIEDLTVYDKGLVNIHLKTNMRSNYFLHYRLSNLKLDSRKTDITAEYITSTTNYSVIMDGCEFDENSQTDFFGTKSPKINGCTFKRKNEIRNVEILENSTLDSVVANNVDEIYNSELVNGKYSGLKSVHEYLGNAEEITGCGEDILTFEVDKEPHRKVKIGEANIMENKKSVKDVEL